MGDPQTPLQQLQAKYRADPYIGQMLDAKFQGLSYDEQQVARAQLFTSKIQGHPGWEGADDATKIETLRKVRTMYPPAFSDPQYEKLRQDLENPDVSRPARKFVYSTGVQMGLTGLGTRGVVNAAKAFSDTLGNVESGISRFFGGNPQPQQDDATLLVRAMGGDKDGVKLAQYLQRKYERPVNPRIPLIGGQTPTQLLGSMLGYGTDLLAMKGLSTATEAAVAAKTATAAPVMQTIAKLGTSAATTGLQGVIRGEVAGAVNAVSQKAPVEGAVDFANGIAATVQSIGSLWGQWAAQDLAFGMLGQGAAAGISNVGKGFLRSVFGRGTAALPEAKMFEETANGEFTPAAQALQKRFVAGNAAPQVMAQLGPIAQDWARSLKETLAYSRETPNAILENPIAAWRIGAQLMQGGRSTPLGIATISDGPGTWRVRQAPGIPGTGDKILGEHLTFPEAEMVTHGEWKREIDLATGNFAKWNARYEEIGGKEDLRQVQSFLLRKEALQDAFPQNQAIQKSLTTLNGTLDRLASEGAARKPSAGAMLTYGEVGQLQGAGMDVAKAQIALPREGMGEIAKRGSLINSDSPMRFSTVSTGDYNTGIVYSKAAPESVFQATLARSQEAIKAGADATSEQLAYSKLRSEGFDAIRHDNGDVTALYPRQQVKHVSDLVNKSSREYTTPEVAAPVQAMGVAPAEFPTSYQAPSMLAGESDRFDWLAEAASREGNTSIQKLPGGEYSLQMRGLPPVQGDLALVTDAFMLRSTTPSHLRASLRDDGMSVRYSKGQYSILDAEGKTLGSGANIQLAMIAAKYRPKLLDGRFGPQNVEVLPDGSPFEYGPQGIRGSLGDVTKHMNGFMDVAAEEGRRNIVSATDGKLSQGHDGAYTVEIPQWGIREKFGDLTEAKDYLNGRYKEYDNIQRLANERGFAFSYEAGRGYVISDATGTYTAHSIEDVGKVLAKVPDARWAPGGKFDAGVTIKDSSDAIKLPADTAPGYQNSGRYYDRGAIGKTISEARIALSAFLAPARATFVRAEREYGIKGLSQAFYKVQESLKAGANQTYLDAQKVQSGGHGLSGKDLVVVDKIMQAISEEERNQVFEDFGIKEGSPKRPQITYEAQRMSKEVYNPIHTRSGQDPNIMLKDYAPKTREFKQRSPEQYQEMEITGPDGMRQLLERTNGGRVPDDMRLAALHERVADVDGVLKEENAHAKAILYAQMANRWAYSAEPMKDFYRLTHAEGTPEPVRALAEHFIDQALNGGASDAQELLRALGREGSTASRRGLVSYLQTTAGMGTYGFRPSSALHIVANGYALGSGYLGTEAMNQGFKASAEGGLPHLMEQFQRDAFTGRVPILYGFGDASMGSGAVAGAFSKLGKASSFFVQNGHIVAKSAIYDAASWLFDRHIKPWVAGGKIADWESKAHDIRGYHLDPGVSDLVEQHLATGDYEAAKHAYAQNMTDKITFQWRPEDQGYALNKGIVAKMYGQLMVMPTQYASALGQLASQGSFLDRVANLAAYAKNTAALYGAERAAGLSGSNLLPWKVITLRGGPLWQAMVNTTSQQPGKRELQTAIKSLSTLAPGVPQVIQGIQVVKEIEAGHPWAAFLTLTGFSVRPDLRAPKR